MIFSFTSRGHPYGLTKFQLTYFEHGNTDGNQDLRMCCETEIPDNALNYLASVIESNNPFIPAYVWLVEPTPSDIIN